MASGIYKIINAVNNKFYVGSAVDLKRRKSRHFSELRNNKHNNKHLQAAWNKYGEQAFVFVVVEETDKTNLLEAENKWLYEHVGKDYCYNIGTDATAPSLGMKGELSPTWGRKRTTSELAAQSWKGRLHRPESKEKIRAYLTGKPRSEATKEKLRAAATGERNPNYGKPRSADFKAKVSRPVVVWKPDGTSYLCDSIVEVQKQTGLKPATIHRALKSQKPISRGPLKGYELFDAYAWMGYESHEEYLADKLS